MSYTITQENFSNITSYRNNPDNNLKWSVPFILPAWLEVWWQELSTEIEPSLNVIRKDEKIIGIAPLQVNNDVASFIGSTDVCDYLDFVVVPGMEENIFNVLLDDLKEKGITKLDLKSLRPDSTVLTYLVNIAHIRGYKVSCHKEDVSVLMDLAPSWEDYLMALPKKQRHEVKRKLRRLFEAGKVEYHTIQDKITANKTMEIFLQMFTESRQDKAEFLTSQRESFFRSLVDTMADIGLLRFGVLEIDTQPLAMVIYFDYNDCIYLYNSGYELKYNSLSVGLLCKVLCIKDNIQKNKKIFDFLKGDEIYKYRLGGKEINLSNCQIEIK
ncbi:MAG: GNAT family N-acetyltransferase [Dehalococcoidales bacterium]|nr:GNAT family N-acetyltransferase [Dehalococcoidales bacterium]